MEGRTAIIYMKHLQLDVALPAGTLDAFLASFGEEFGTQSPYFPKDIERIYWQGCYHIIVSVAFSDEEKFYDFFRRFCEEQKISMREDDLQSVHPYWVASPTS